VAHQNRLLLPQSVNEADQITYQVEESVGLDWFWLIGLAVPAQIGRNGMVASFSQSRELVAPRIPELGKPVAQEHEWSGSLFGKMDSYPIGGDYLM
jgi:hypothetical protein